MNISIFSNNFWSIFQPYYGHLSIHLIICRILWVKMGLLRNFQIHYLLTLMNKHPNQEKDQLIEQNNLKSKSNNNNNNDNNNDNNNNNLHLNRVIQFNGKDLPRGLLACLQVATGPQGYKVVEYIAFRY